MTPKVQRVLGRAALKTAAGVTLAYILTPLFFVVWLSFFYQEIPSFPPEGYSLRWYRSIWGNDRFLDGFLLSVQVALVATGIGVCLGVPAALAVSRHRFTGREAEISIEPRRRKAEFEDWRWAHADEAIDLAVPHKRDFYARVLAALSVHVAPAVSARRRRPVSWWQRLRTAIPAPG